MNKSFKITTTFIFLAVLTISFLFLSNFWENKNSEQKVGEAVVGESLNPEEGKVESVDEGKQYTHPLGWFSFIYPLGISLSYLSNPDGDAILLSGLGSQAQVFCRDLGEAVTVTVEKIKTDIPDIKMSEAKSFKADGAAGVLFKDESTNTTEAWFSKNNIFCQLSSLGNNFEITNAIIKGWKWR